MENHFKLLLNRYENNLETSISGSDLFFCYIKNFIKQIQIVVDWIKNKKATINTIIRRNNKRFQYAITVALNHKQIGKHPERITKTWILYKQI